jgi:rhodanese-related sulfurtransferase
MIETIAYDATEAHDYFSRKVAFTTGPVEVSHQIEDGENINIVDVRAAEDYEKGHIPGALSLPKERWDTMACLRKDALNILYCYTATCHLAAKAAVGFAAEGYQVMEMDGGFEAWKQNKLKVEK